jgi:hypothetical protein
VSTGLRVVLGPERLPDPVALGGAELRPGGHPDQGGLDLGAAAPAEQPADDAGGGDQVGHGEVLRFAGPGQDVLAGVVVGADRLVDVGVDAGDVVGDVGVELLAAGALLAQRVDLGLQVRLGVRRVGPDALFQLPVARGAAGEGGERAATDVPQQVHHPEPVLRPGVAGAEHGARAGGAGDVWHAGRLVAHDGDVRAGPHGALHLPVGHAERGVVVELRDLFVGESGVAVDQVRVLVELVAGVRGPGAERLVREDRGEGGVAVLPGRQDVGALAEAVVVAGEGGGGDGR